jgi:flagellar basal body-associated protein FliL
MIRGSQLIFKILAIIFFLLAIAGVLATLFFGSGSDRSPGLFLAVVLAGVGKWLWGKSQGKSARETFGRAIEVAQTDDLSELADGSRQMADRSRRKTQIP